jgi:hypothetical protein
MVFCTRVPGVLRAVNCNWNDDGWNLNANEVDNPNEWNAGNQVFSRNLSISPVIWREFYLRDPFANRRAFVRFLQLFLKARNIFLWGQVYFPKPIAGKI